ncbi:hypothetical protein PT974_06412 [Cladobotryum mycophilum]|uniref:Domain of unknown function at the cortex 1 domain-containing protein n=1 Tax=Cladobotryum mycophilum TaxID=491253 RepID=A0ABR0SM61_9HYPO
MAEKYILRITAGPSYDEATHIEVPVNKSEPVHIKSETAAVELNVRIQNYQGLPRGSPSTSPYFSTEPHAYNQDQYSISFRFTPLKPSSQRGDSGSGDEPKGISATDLQFGNDFDRPIRDRLPPGFSTAMNIVRWWIDPGLDGDAYADKPYLYGPALSSFNVISVGGGTHDEEKGGLWFEEGGDEDGMAARSAIGAPSDTKARMKWALQQNNKEKWIWEYGKTYGLDFFNPYLDFANLALRLPGFQLSVVKYWDGQGLRYVLRHKTTGEVYLVIVFSLFLKDDVNEDGTIKESAEGTRTPPGVVALDDVENGELDEDKALQVAREQLGPAAGESQADADDVD